MLHILCFPVVPSKLPSNKTLEDGIGDYLFPNHTSGCNNASNKNLITLVCYMDFVQRSFHVGIFIYATLQFYDIPTFEAEV